MVGFTLLLMATLTLEVGTIPDAGSLRKESAGSVIYERYRIASEEMLAPLEGVKMSLPQDEVLVPAKAPLIRIATKAKLKACTEAITGYIDTMPWDAGGHTCFIDDDGDGFFDRIAANDVAGAKPLPKPIRYDMVRVPRRHPEGDFRQIITFQGSNKDTLMFGYREFIDDLARPAFTEQFTFAMPNRFPHEIAIKDIRIMIEGIDGLGISYRIQR